MHDHLKDIQTTNMSIQTKPPTPEYEAGWDRIFNNGYVHRADAKKIYLAGPMRNLPYFNFPAFFEAAKKLREQGHIVFNPADRDVSKYGEEVYASPTGNLEDVKHLNFSLRDSLAADTAFICREADAVYLLPGWENSKGARAERGLAECLGLEIVEL